MTDATGGDVASARRGGDEPILQVDGIHTFYDTSHILHDVSLDVAAEETVALVGRNGAGKTTTLRSIIGLTPPREGRITFQGEEIQGSRPHEIRKRGVSWVPENRRVFPNLTVAQNLELAAAIGDDAVDIDRMYSRFERLDERRTQQAGTLSGGEQQMLAIARALVGPPTELLMLDEPSEGLAPQIVADVRDIIQELRAEGTTILLVEQNAELALGLADRAYVLETGRIVHEGDASALLADDEAMESYLGVS
jgi:branched-chain amino acid transport system ATP-binding protein